MSYQEVIDTATGLIHAASKVQFQDALSSAAVLAITTHLIAHHNEPTFISFVSSVLAASTGVFAVWALELPLVVAALQTLALTATYLTVLGLSIAVYRNSPLHPLYHIPGPFWARTTALWWFNENYKSNPRLTLQQVHAKYGDVVRIAPNEVSINNVDAIAPIHGGAGWPKPFTYQQGLLTSWPKDKPEEANLIAILDHTRHGVRRKLWDKAFSSSAIAQYHPMLMHRTQELTKCLETEAAAGRKVDLHRWAHYFVYDVMADLAFGGGFGLLAQGNDPQGILHVIVQANSLHALVESLPWIKPIFAYFPANADVDRVFALSRGKFEERAAKGATADVKDVFHHLMDREEATGKPLPLETLAKESQLVVGAGADTTKTVIVMAIYYMFQQPELYKRLQAEMDEMLAHGPMSPSLLENAPFLNAVVNETLRLAPPITIGVKRMSPGAVVVGTYIPEKTIVRIPKYGLQRDPRYFSHPNEFRPDRWLKSSKEDNFDRHAFFPFVVGPFGCVGKQVALQELRVTIGSFAATFDGKFAPGFDYKGFEGTLRDRFLLEFEHEMEIVLTKRKGVDHGIADGV